MNRSHKNLENHELYYLISLCKYRKSKRANKHAFRVIDKPSWRLLVQSQQESLKN